MNELTITQLQDNIWNFTEHAPGTAVDAYLVTGSQRAVMIEARELTDLPLDLILTHGHFDHAGASTQEFVDAGCKIYMAMADYPVLTGYSGRSFPKDIFTDLADGQTFDLGGESLRP